MAEFPLTIASILEHGVKVHGASEVTTWTGNGAKRSTFREVGVRARQLAAALSRLGIRAGDRVGTLCWNTQEHLEAYFAVSSMGAVIHTINLRLFPDQLAYVINHAEDRVIIVDASLVALLARVAGDLRTVERYIVVGETAGLPGECLDYEVLLAAESPDFEWPILDERSAAALCYTTGTTGDPKGVAYSHRSTYLHSIALCAAWAVGLTDHDRVLPIVPMFHANAWGVPYAGWMSGSDFLMPASYLQPEPLCCMIRTCRPTVFAGVPSVLTAALYYAETHPADFSSIRLAFCGGAAMPRSLAEKFLIRHNVQVIQGWGLTETSPVAALAHPPRRCAPEDEIEWTTKSGRLLAGVELRLCDGDKILEWDGESIGEIEVRGPWITASYYRSDEQDKFHDGWLRTGDVGVVDGRGYIHITDRSKDVIKSGGEWISSVDLENAIADHPDVFEAAVIGIPDEKWDERPLACVVPKPGSEITISALRDHLSSRVAKWWIPDQWVFIAEVPKTSVGKFDKKALRAMHGEGRLQNLPTT
ncbi:MAG TPA: long-chain fatty acid--CoA ligase [Terracidiphilus sp.]